MRRAPRSRPGFGAGAVFSRRALLVGGAAGLAGLAASACGAAGTGERTSAPAGGLGPLAVALGWARTTQFAGSLTADRRGFWLEEGFASVDLLAGGPGVDPLAALSAGGALLAITSAAAFAEAAARGAPLRAVAAGFARTPFAVVSRRAAPLTNAEALVGRRVGVAPALAPLWRAALAAAGLREGEGPGAVQRVDAASSVAPLLADQLDGLLAFAPVAAAELAARGETAVTLSLAELGVTTRDQLYVTTEEALATRRPAVVAALRGEARGWREASHDHEAARDLAVDVYGAELDLDPAGQLELLRRTLTLMRPADGESPLQLSAESTAADAALLTRLGWPIGPAAFAVDVMAEVDTSGFALG